MSLASVDHPATGSEGSWVKRRTLVIKGSFEDSMGGSVVAALNRGRAAAADGWHVTVATTTDGRDSLGLLEESGLPHRLFRRRFPRALSSSPAMLWWLLRRGRDFDLIEVHEIFAFPTFYARLAAGFHGVPLVIHPNNSLDPYDLRKHQRVKSYLRPLLRWLLAGSGGIWTASRLEADRLETFGAAVERFVSPLPVELPRQGDGAADTPGGHVLFLGRLDRKKGVERLISAVGIAQGRGATLTTVIAGTGDEDYVRALKAQAAAELVPGTFHFPGHVVGEAREALFANASVFVLHSDNENFGIAVIEALGHGLPVVLSPEVYIARDIESRGVASVVPVDDLDGLAESIVRYATRRPGPDARLAESARAVAADYDTPACISRDAAIRRTVTDAKKGYRARG
jgi:glycosyltransferase involved in cell wall biosynthesis